MPSRGISVRSGLRDPHILQSDLPPDVADTGLDSSTGGRFELDAHAETLEQAKAVIAGECVRLLALPIEGLRDVVNACSTNEQGGGELAEIMKALEALVCKTDSALVLSNKLITSAKHILSQMSSSAERPRTDTLGSVRSTVQKFLNVDGPGIEGAVAIWAARELEHDGHGQPSSLSVPAQGLATSSESTAPSLANPESLQDRDKVQKEKRLGLDAYDRYVTGHSIEDLHDAIDHYKMAFDLTFPGDPDRSGILNNFGSTLSKRFGVLGQIADLEQAVIYHRGALELRPPGHPYRSGSLNNLGAALRTRFSALGQIADLEQAITYHCDALELCPLGRPNRSSCLNYLGYVLSKRFGVLGQIADLEQAIIYHRCDLGLCPPGHPNRSSCLSHLGSVLSTRFGILGQIADLEQAIIYHRGALALRPPGHPNRSGILNNLGFALSKRFGVLGQIADLEQAIIYHRGDLELCPHGHPNRHSCLSHLGSVLSKRFGVLGQIADLEQAIIYHRGALALRPPGHPNRSGTLKNLGFALSKRFGVLGQIADLEQAIIYHHGDLELRPPGHPDRSSCLIHLGSELSTRFGVLGQIADLEQAIIYHRGALELCPPGHPDRSVALNNLGLALSTRFGILGQIADLEQAIIYHRSALELRPPRHPNRSGTLNNLGYALSTRFGILGQIADLEQAIVYHRGALELCPPGHPDRSVALNNLGLALSTRFGIMGQIADLEQVIIYHRGALELCPPGHPNRSKSLNNLGYALSTRFGILGQIADLEQAIIYHRGALELHPVGHPHRAISSNNLALALRTRFEKLNTTEDLHETVDLLHSGAQDVTDTPKHRYTCVSRLISLLEKHNQSLLLNAYDMALGLLQLVLAVYPDVTLRRETLGADTLSPSLAMSAAAHAIQQNQPGKAIEMLEQGRGMLYSNMRGYREPVEAVREVKAALADRFKSTSDQLEALAVSSQQESKNSSSEGSNEPTAASDARWAQQRQLSVERDNIIGQIRLLPGFEHFLRAVPFSELQIAAAEGPVIIVNVAQRRSDAIILHKDHPPVVVSIPADSENGRTPYLTFVDLSRRLFEGRTEAGFSKLLEKVILKKVAELLVTPVLEKLEGMGVSKKSRIWWCPTSALCALPIHAAGELPIKFVSSYTPTLSALIRARKADDQQPPATLNAIEADASLLAIVYPGHPPKTEDECDDRLHTIFKECQVIKNAAEASRAHGGIRVEATREVALEQLPHHRWVHFACHGRLNASGPFQSAFELEDDLLSLYDLVQARLPNADFAFLAACDGATSGGNTNTPDESSHLAAAVQFCGVRSVVGTLWPMADVDGPRVAQVFYRHMFKENDSRKSAEALAKVVTHMRKKTGPWANANDEGEFLQRWANYIHIGA
ncbi:hypothetical protein HWV62_36743 [Athelia sp. TMB]|nr:hypothetical protein HWV62_36743 [Athelia sp. TMB]